jgi:hypothetical protein
MGHGKRILSCSVLALAATGIVAGAAVSALASSPGNHLSDNSVSHNGNGHAALAIENLDESHPAVLAVSAFANTIGNRVGRPHASHPVSDPTAVEYAGAWNPFQT